MDSFLTLGVDLTLTDTARGSASRFRRRSQVDRVRVYVGPPSRGGGSSTKATLIRRRSAGVRPPQTSSSISVVIAQSQALSSDGAVSTCGLRGLHTRTYAVEDLGRHVGTKSVGRPCGFRQVVSAGSADSSWVLPVRM